MISDVCVLDLLPLLNGWLLPLVLGLYNDEYLLLKCVLFDYTALNGSGKVKIRKLVNHTSWVAVITPTDCPKPKSLCNITF